MGGKQPKPEPVPQKTMKELAKEFTRKIKRMEREFDREIFKFQQSNNKIRADIRKMLEKGESKVMVWFIKNNIKLVAGNVRKNENFIKKYQRLNAQLNDVLYQFLLILLRIQASATTETMVGVMKGMRDVRVFSI